MMSQQPAEATEIHTHVVHSYTVGQERKELRPDMVMDGDAVLVFVGYAAEAGPSFVPFQDESEEFSLLDVAVSDEEILAWGDALPRYEGPDDMVDFDI